MHAARLTIAGLITAGTLLAAGPASAADTTTWPHEQDSPVTCEQYANLATDLQNELNAVTATADRQANAIRDDQYADIFKDAKAEVQRDENVALRHRVAHLRHRLHVLQHRTHR